MSDEDKEKETSMVDISAIDIYPLIGLFINILNTQAWQYMGLRINPAISAISMPWKRIPILHCSGLKGPDPSTSRKERAVGRNYPVRILRVSGIRQE